MNIREPMQRTSPPQQPIEFRHPFHRATEAVFLKLEAFPCSLTDQRACVPLVIALAACRVLTGAPETSFLSIDDSQTPVQDECLYGSRYFFYTSLDDDDNYLLHHGFSLWTPPPRSQVPSEWFLDLFPAQDADPYALPPWFLGSTVSSRHSDVSRYTKGLMRRCVLSGHPAYIEGSHIVPQALRQWYEKHAIWNQLRPIRILAGWQESAPAAINDARNYLTHEAGIHRIFDAPQMTYYPLAGHYVAVFLKGMPTHVDEYHLRRAAIPVHVDPYLLYVRFAYTIFHCSVRQNSFSYYALPPTPKRGVPRARSSNSGGNGGGDEMGGGPSTGGSDRDDDSVNDPADGDVDMLGPQGFNRNGNLDTIFEAAEAAGVMIAPEFGDEMHYHPDLARIAEVRSKYVEANPQVYMMMSSSLPLVVQ